MEALSSVPHVTACYTAPEVFDCLVIGAGPAGLTAAIYLARFHLSVIAIDDARSRAALIPRTRNHPGFPNGITGQDLLARMRRQAELYGAILVNGEVLSLAKDGVGFTAKTPVASFAAKTVLLATGVVNRRPALLDQIHDAALAAGLLRYCPICDAYELTDQPIAVLGTGERGLREAEFLRGYTAAVTMIAPDGPHDLKADQQIRLTDAGVVLVDGPCLGVELGPAQIDILLRWGRLSFASVYPALGSDIRSELAVGLGANVSEEGCLIVDKKQRTNVPGLYAAGDVVLGLDQISHAMGEGGVAATTIRNDLAALHPPRRCPVTAGVSHVSQENFLGIERVT